MQDEMNDLQYTKPEDPDIVRVVRCKDCKYIRRHALFEHEYFQCERPHKEYFVTEPDDFCSYGDRKDG